MVHPSLVIIDWTRNEDFPQDPLMNFLGRLQASLSRGCCISPEETLKRDVTIEPPKARVTPLDQQYIDGIPAFSGWR